MIFVIDTQKLKWNSVINVLKYLQEHTFHQLKEWRFIVRSEAKDYICLRKVMTNKITCDVRLSARVTS